MTADPSLPSSPRIAPPLRHFVAAWGLLVIALAGCRTVPTAVFTPLAAGSAAASAAVAALDGAVTARQALRAEARVSVAGATGESFTRQLLLVERPAKLRLEVVGLLEQRILVLASDGEEYDLYRAETARIEGGVVHDALLLETTGLPVTPGEVVGLLLASPEPGEGPPQAARAEDGRLRLVWPDRTVELDAEGRPQTVVLGADRARVQYADWRTASDGLAFPYRIQIDAAAAGISARIDFRKVEIDPAAPPHVFRLSAREGSGTEPRAVMLPAGGRAG